MLIEHLNRRLREREAQSLGRSRRIATSPCAPWQRVRHENGECELLGFCTNDYLGLASHPALATALADGVRRFGVGSGASHLISGHGEPHAALEEDLAAFLAPCIPDASTLVFGSGYLANLALMATLGDAQATTFADKLNHASLIDGGLLARANMQRYAHGRLDVLERQLQRCETPVRLIVSDAVFSMDGDLADLPALLEVAERHDAWLIVDDAHGFGVLGAQGRGSLSHFGLRSERLIYMGTLGKAAGIAGAFVAAHPVIVEALLQGARSYIYTTAAPPAIAHALVMKANSAARGCGNALRNCASGSRRCSRSGLHSVGDCARRRPPSNRWSSATAKERCGLQRRSTHRACGCRRSAHRPCLQVRRGFAFP